MYGVGYFVAGKGDAVVCPRGGPCKLTALTKSGVNSVVKDCLSLKKVSLRVFVIIDKIRYQ